MLILSSCLYLIYNFSKLEFSNPWLVRTLDIRKITYKKTLWICPCKRLVGQLISLSALYRNYRICKQMEPYLDKGIADRTIFNKRKVLLTWTNPTKYFLCQIVHSTAKITHLKKAVPNLYQTSRQHPLQHHQLVIMALTAHLLLIIGRKIQGWMWEFPKLRVN